MILYIEKEILLDTHCQDLYLCDTGVNNEYLVTSSIDQCSCKKQQAILCKYDHDLCQNRCLSEQNLYIKQNNESNEILINNHSTNVILLEKNELEYNSEIVYICDRNNLPKPILEHLNNKLTYTKNNSTTDVLISQTAICDFLLKHSVLVQNAYGMYLKFQQARHNPFQLRRHANIGYLLANIFVGILCSFILFGNFDLNRLISNEILIQTQNLTTWIKSIIEWLMHAPVGLKLNQPLVDFLARFYFYHIYLWSGYLEALVITVLPYLYQLMFILCFFGISLVIGAICDFIRLLTIHLYCFYIYAARLFNWQIRLLINLFRLFCGKKQNPLRNYRLDSHLCDIDQLFIVTLSFTILLFLLPSIFMYYAVFTSIWTVTVLTVKIIQYIGQFLLQIPIYEFYLWIMGSRIIRGTPRLSINYGYSTDNTVCFNFHFDPVSFFTLYHVCNIHSSLSLISFSKLFLTILKGQPMI
ncbi:unnamed protein product [Adineta steineri]|uniref:Phosphatidylinositol N-acetylglucosaminyltransferase subunit Q n=1 Tax=Adineta steineri TaxID=433720 RepID=A0A819JA43_9BILA|nr:unnamed protein product [Adineta steineri]